MKKIYFITLIILTFSVAPAAVAQQPEADRITENVLMADTEFAVQFLASDELYGRDTGTNELDIAAAFIASWFKSNGIDTLVTLNGYYQDVPLVRKFPPTAGQFTVGDSVFTVNKNFININGPVSNLEAPLIFLEYGTSEEISEADVEGKIVVVEAGFPGENSPQQFFSSSDYKRHLLSEAGASGLIELYSSRQLPWQLLVNFLNRETMSLDRPDETVAPMPHIWFNAVNNPGQSYLREHEMKTVSLNIEGKEAQEFTSRNVAGFIEGTDPVLKNEIIMLSAHYDHVGTLRGQTDGNYIFNGARDNAVGVAAILQAAKYAAKNPPKRSVLIAAWTAEEKGLIGSRWFSENPPLDIEKIVYNMNIDGAGYNDTTKVSVIGLGRTDADPQLISAAAAFGLEAIPDPAPEQGLFDRSDNVNFARLGIPSPTYSMGFTAFDDDINYYYHQVTDTPDSLNYSYVLKYIQSYVLAVMEISNRNETPFWVPGDVYEEPGIELYGMDKE